MSDKQCEHFPTPAVAAPARRACPQCEREGMRWVHLRQCLVCGQVGCCDSSPGRHATRHFESSGHAVIRSIEAGESWTWCYVHQQMFA